VDIIVDLDGTLTDCRHRLHHLETKDWGAFFAGMYDDEPNTAVLATVEALMDAHHRIIYCSGRPEQYRSITDRWLLKWMLPIEPLYMRKKGDYRPDDVIKFELLIQIREEGYDPVLVIDDRPSVVNMWRRHGLSVFQYLQPLNPDDHLDIAGR
jgi:hypothetical protein